MRSDTVIAPTLIVTTASNDRVQVPTLPVCLSADRDLDAANLWAELMFAEARPASDDVARFAANLLADFA
jgi:hypothetical protein